MNRIFYLLLLVASVSCNEQVEKEAGKAVERPEVRWTGAMRNVMHTGDLSGKIALDSINDIPHLYGLGPTEGLEREILVMDGTAYVSAVATDSTMDVTEEDGIKAPFFVYSYVKEWEETELPDSITSINQVEAYLDQLVNDTAKPFVFKISAAVDSAIIHIVNLEKGAEVSSPADAHKDLKQFPVVGQKVDIIGFFSREHQAVFIHHDALTHMHLITQGKEMMGHLDELAIESGSAKLYMAVN